MEKYTYLLLTILATTLMMTGIRESKRWGMDLLQVTTFNYFTAVLIGLCFFSPSAHYHIVLDHSEVLPVAFILGTSFIFIFVVMGTVTRLAGMAYMAFISKMALMIPVLFSWLRYSEPLTTLRIIGIITALIAVSLISYRKTGNEKSIQNKKFSIQNSLLLLSIILFFGSGLNDSLFKLFSNDFKGQVSDDDFAIFVFTVAGTLGMIGVIYFAISGKTPITLKNIIGGIGVGIPNYFSLVFLTKGLKVLDGTVFFPVNNIGILMAAALTGIFIYKEKFSALNIAGMAFALISIWLMV